MYIKIFSHTYILHSAVYDIMHLMNNSSILSAQPLVFNKFLMNFALLQYFFFFPFLLLKVQKIAKVNNSSE